MNANLIPPTTTAVYNFDGSIESWTKTSGTGTVAYDATDPPPNGGGSMKLTTNGAGAACFADSPVFSDLDMTGKFFVMWVKCDDFDKLNLTFVNLLADDVGGSYAGFFQWSYGGIITTDNDWIQVALSFSNASNIGGTPDRTAIDRFRFRVADDSSGAVNVWLGGIHTADEAPEGAVVFEFDDAHASVYDTVFPIMTTAGLVGTIGVIPDFVGDTSPVDYMTWDELREMRDAGWDVVAHYQSVMTGNTVAANEAIIRGVQAQMQAQGLGAGSRHFTYVGGQHDANLLEAMANTCVSGRTTIEAAEPLPLSSPYRQRCELVLNTTTVAHITDQFDAAKANKDLLRTIMHRVVTTPSVSTEMSTANFQSVVNYVGANSIPTNTVTGVLGAYSAISAPRPDLFEFGIPTCN